MPQLRGGTLPNVARIELGSQLEAFQGTVFCHRRHLLSDYKSFRKAFSSLMKNLYFFTSNTNSKPNFKAAALPHLQRNKLFCVNAAWLCADFYMRHCPEQLHHLNSSSTHLNKNLKGKRKWACSESAQLFAQNTSNKNCKAGFSPALHSAFWHLSGQKVGQLQPPQTSAQGCKLGAQHPAKGKTNLAEGQTALLKPGKLRRINQPCLYLPV